MVNNWNYNISGWYTISLGQRDMISAGISRQAETVAPCTLKLSGLMLEITGLIQGVSGSESLWTNQGAWKTQVANIDSPRPIDQNL